MIIKYAKFKYDYTIAYKLSVIPFKRRCKSELSKVMFSRFITSIKVLKRILKSSEK